ncbi:hypothetical protein EYF80_022911 [Liparis tanakae]|uniref:Uncharacterized protein n=1 Tax=Liparis tanakae TaxID=230148 RepID=A0A4Z2HPZ3_9TELE|nr:hypothetical protein EYF80_022911 [Liparis tanakae]
MRRLFEKQFYGSVTHGFLLRPSGTTRLPAQRTAEQERGRNTEGVEEEEGWRVALKRNRAFKAEGEYFIAAEEVAGPPSPEVPMRVER